MKYEMKECLASVLPGYLLSLMSHLFGAVEAQLQKDSSDAGRAYTALHHDNTPLKRALDTLRVVQQGLVDRVHRMSPEEQLALAYFIYTLNKSLVEYRGSLEQLQTSREVATLATVLLSIGRSTQEHDSNHAFSYDVFFLVAYALSSMIYNDGIVFVRHPIVMEAFAVVDARLSDPARMCAHPLISPQEAIEKIDHSSDNDMQLKSPSTDHNESQPSSLGSGITDSSISVVPPDFVVTQPVDLHFVSDYSSEESDMENHALCFNSQLQYTDSVTSSGHSPPKKKCISKNQKERRKLAKERMVRYRLDTSDSDSNANERICLRPKPSSKKHDKEDSNSNIELTHDSEVESLSVVSSGSEPAPLQFTTEKRADQMEQKSDTELEPLYKQNDVQLVIPTGIFSHVNLQRLRQISRQPTFTQACIMDQEGVQPCLKPVVGEEKMWMSLYTEMVRSCLNMNLPDGNKDDQILCSPSSLDTHGSMPKCGGSACMSICKSTIAREFHSTSCSKPDKNQFKKWILTTIQAAGYNHLKNLIHPQWYSIFGFVLVRGERLTQSQKKMARIVLDVVQSKKSSIPKYVLKNLRDLKKVLSKRKDASKKKLFTKEKSKEDTSDLWRGRKKPLKNKPKSSTDGAAVKPLHGTDSDYSTGTNGNPKSFRTTPSHSETPHRNKTKVTQAKVEVYPTQSLPEISDKIPYEASIQEDSAVSSVLGFANANNSLQVIRSHLTTYSKCCPRHDIQNIVVVGTTCPASDAFGPKRRYSSIKDIKDGTRHTPFNASEKLNGKGNSEKCMSQSTLQVMDRQIPENKIKLPLQPQNISSHQQTQKQEQLLAPPDHKERLQSAAELLHAQNYPQILPLSYEGKPPTSLAPLVRIPYVFITALAYYKMSNHKKSVQHFQHCLQLAQECNRLGDVTICNIYIGDIEFAQRKYIEAANKYRTALDYYDRDSVAKDFRMILPTKSAVWSKCGSAFKNASRMGDSVAAYERAIEVATSMKDKLSAHTCLGNLYQGIGENGRAVKEYEDAIALATELKDNVSLGWNHGNLGNALLGLHQRDKALHHLFKALNMAVDYETTPQAIGRAYNNLGTAFQSLSEHDKAEEYYDLALAQAIYGNDVPGQARVYGNIGNLQMLKKHYDRAVPHYTEVMRLSQDKSTITTAHHNRGCAYYDWAEEKKNTLIKKTSPTVSTGFKISLHGQMFEQCDEGYRLPRVPDSIQKYYLQGTRDLEYVIKHHEENFSCIKGSPKGLSLSVSLFETNSRTFHRMQDCLVHLKNGDNQPSRFEDALLFAEQSRARTLGELLLKRRGPQLQHQLVSPPSLVQLKSTVSRTMGIFDQLPAVSVTIPVQYQQMLCVVGNPTIPPFKYNNDEWNLGKLPHATKEAEWVSHILKCKPILHEQATKDAVMMRIMNGKVIHLATHGSAVAGFLAFAGMSASSNDTVDAKKVLIYPEEIESLNISPALVVLSSCDSGRGVIKADGIQGMARAFILAGAQAVLTTLWRVPDESACIFMQFFYQYLVEGVKGTEALHKAILSLRCFSKYSEYIHWSGYQLTGRELQFDVNQSLMHGELTARLGPSSVFPRLDILKHLQTTFLDNPRLPTDVQVCVYYLHILRYSIRCLLCAEMDVTYPQSLITPIQNRVQVSKDDHILCTSMLKSVHKYRKRSAVKVSVRKPYSTSHNKKDKNHIKQWILSTIQRAGYNQLRHLIDPQWYSVFGFVPVGGERLTKSLKKRARIVLDVVQSKKSSIPKYVLQNLNDLKKLLTKEKSEEDTLDQWRGRKKPLKGKPKGSTDGAAVKVLHERDSCSTGTITDGNSKLFSTTPSHSKAPYREKTKVTPEVDTTQSLLGYSDEVSRQEESAASSVLGFANANNSLQVIRSHLTTYSKCCPRHDIQNIVVVGTTCPASDAFGPKRRYSSIKDIKDDAKHTPFNASEKLNGKGNSEKCISQPSLQVMDRHMPHMEFSATPQPEKSCMHNPTLQKSCASILNSSLKDQPLEKGTTPSHSSYLVCGTKFKSVHTCLEYFKDIHDASTEVDMYICLYYDQEEFHVAHPKFNIPISSNVCMETCVSDALSIVQTNYLQKVVVVIDAKANFLYPTVIPILQEKWIGSFHFRFILFPPGMVGPDLPAIVHSPVNALVVGNPTISPNNNNQIKVFPPLHCGTKEAEFVSYILKCIPILHENATKEAVINNMQNASFVHIATHVSGSEGYLAFACTSSFTTTNLMEFCMTPQEVEKLELPLVLVVLSSCNSAKMKYGGGEVEGMTKAFLRAGAQAVISSNLKVWDDSALVFMQFFYHYFIVDQMKGVEALHKAMISMHCIPQYSDPSHWSPYAYYGKEVEFRSNLSPSSTQLTSCLGPCSVFPRMDVLKALKSEFLNCSTTLPTNVQVLMMMFVC